MGEDIIGILIFVSLFILLFVFIIWCRTDKGKGFLGECRIKWLLGRSKKGKRYIFNNIIVSDQGKSSQIDHILINHSGIYVIETKNYSGIISGHKNDMQWTQTLAYGKVKNKFYNPIKQNATHIYRLRKYIPENIPIFSIVVFVKADIRYVSAEDIYTPRRLKKHIKKGANILTSDMIDSLKTVIQDRINESIPMRQHIKQINSMKKNIAENICPRCGGSLVLRNGKYGSFYGCSNYPSCRFIKKS